MLEVRRRREESEREILFSLSQRTHSDACVFDYWCDTNNIKNACTPGSDVGQIVTVHAWVGQIL